MAGRRIAIVGSGPAGFYCVEALGGLLTEGKLAGVDMFERNLAPNGLARHGVAPDHPEMRAVEAKFAEWAHDLRPHGFRWFGGSSVADLSILRQRYDAVILAHGADQEKKLGIPGEEDNPQVVPAGRFVSWYNALPPLDGASSSSPSSPSSNEGHFDPRGVLCSGRAAAVIGLGNVALDVARILLKPADELASTDMPSACVEALRSSTIRDVHLIGRRGPVQSAFTAKELREILKLPGVRVHFEEQDLASVDTEPQSKALLQSSRKHARIFEQLRNAAVASSAADSNNGAEKNLYFHFYRSPSAIHGTTAHPVDSLELTRNRLVEDRVVATDVRERLPCSLIVPSIGYTPTLFRELPFDRAGNHVAHTGGKANGVEGVYVVGWLKRGPQGVIPDNRWDAQETVASLLDDLATLPRPPKSMGGEDLDAFFPERIDFQQWSVVDEEEKRLGQAVGKPREKFTSSRAMRHVLRSTSRTD